MHTDPLIDLFQHESDRHLRDYLRILLHRKATILTVAVITFVAVALITFSKTPIYTASTQVLIEKNVTGGNMEGLRMYMFWDPEFMSTQFELIRSFNVALRVVDRLQLDRKYKDAFFKQQDRSFSVLAFIRQTFSSLTSAPPAQVRKPAPDARVENRNTSDAERIAAVIQAGLRVAPVKDTKIVRILYNHQDPAMAQMVADSVVQAYIDETLDIKASSTRYTLHWMTGKADEERNKLEASEKALQQYMRNNDIVTVENKLAIYPQKLTDFNSQLSSALAREKELEAIYRQIEKAGTNYNMLETIPLFTDNSVLQNLRDRLYSSEQNIKDLSKKYGYKHPAIIKAKAERDLLLEEKEAEINRIIESTKNGYELARTRIQNLSQLISSTKNEMMDMNERFVQYTIMKREMEMNQAVYDALATSIKKANVTEQSQDIKIWVVKKADLPGAPSQPNKKKKLLQGLIIGLFGGILLAFFLEYLDNTVKSGKEFEERYKLTVLGSVEDLTGKNISIETYIQDNPLSPLAESYRLIRSGLLLSSPDHPPKTILITSMVQQEGKTITTGNLAHILAQNNKKVLIIDCDLRRPRLHSLFGIVNSYGLSNVLSGNTDEEQPLIRPTADDDISLITSGPVPPNPAELLSSKNMTRMLAQARQEYDFILLDSPPVQQVTDSLTLAAQVDGTVVVIRAGKTTHEMLDSGIKKLRETQAHILGVVLNRLKKKNAEKGYYGYYSYYSREKKSSGSHDA